jgi:hypothetical protein
MFLRLPMGLERKVNHDLNTDHPTQVNDLSIMPRSMIDYVGPEFSFPVTLRILSVLLINLIALNVQSWIVFTLGL